MQQDDIPDGGRTIPSPALVCALNVLSIVKDTGLALVPPDPTDAMVAAGMAVSGASAEQTRAVYRAMIAAAVEPMRPAH